METRTEPQGPENGSSTDVNFILMARFDGHVNTQDLRSALDRLKGRQRAFVAPGRHFPPDFETGAYPLCVLHNCDPEDWKKRAAVELALPFENNTPRVRFVLLNHAAASDLLLVCDHNGSDGLSASFLLQDLLALLNDPQAIMPPLPVPPPVWEVLPPSVTKNFSGKIHALIIRIVLSIKQWKQNRKESAPKNASFQVTAAECSAELTNTLLDRCRLEGTSVHAAVCTAWLSALTPAQSKSSKHRSVSSPVSLRKYLPPDMQRCAGMFYTTVITSLKDCAGRDFWDKAREVKQQMQEAETKQSFYTFPLLFKVLYESIARLKPGETFQMPDPDVNYDFSITNLGLMKNAEISQHAQNTRYSLSALYGPMVNAFAGEKTVGVCTLNGQIRFVLTSFPQEMDLSTAENLLDRAMQQLQRAVLN